MNFHKFQSISKYLLLSILIGLTAALIVMAYDGPSANPPSGDVLSPVRLQSSTPGDQQTGNINISGTGLFAGNVGIGTTGPLRKLDIIGQGATAYDQLLLSNVATDNTLKYGGVKVLSYDSDEEPILVIGGHGHSSYNNLYIGGGDSSSNSATSINFYTASAINTLTGTQRMIIDSDGNVGIGTTDPNEKLSVAGTIESTTGGFKFPDATVQTTAVVPTYYTSGSVDPPNIDGTDRDVMTVSFTLSKTSLVYAWYSMTGGEGKDGRMWCGMHLDDGSQNESGWVENDQDEMYTIHGSTAWANVSAGSHHVDIKCHKSGTANDPWRGKLDVITF